ERQTHRGAGRPEIPDQSQSREQAQHVVGDVDLPPEPALVGGVLVVVVVVVPALSASDQREEEVVPAGVGRLVTAWAEDVAGGGDGERLVPGDPRCGEKGPQQERESPEQEW